MSWISAQCDQLRERAKELCSLAPDPAVPYLVPSTKETMALAMRSAASEMEDAADTILSLRDMAQVLRAENAKLRGARDVWQENDAKLRELIADLWEYIHIGTAQDGQSLHDRTRELGIVDSDERMA